MIPRYTTPEMARLWAEENRFAKWLEVELAVCRALAERGVIPRQALHEIERKAQVPKVERIAEIERRVHHDVIAFLSALAEIVGPESRYIHLGLTSNDIVDTAQAILLKEASELILAEMRRLGQAIREQAYRYKDTPMVGRTHGVHAEPTTFGLKLAVWYSEHMRNIGRLERAARAVACGKLSGAVGTFAHLDPEIEESVCSRLGIDYARASSQIVQRDRHAEYLAALAITGASYDKFATEIRHLQRTEVREVEEPFRAGQKGSSAMPHKRNPVSCEQVSGLSRLLRGYLQAALENVPLWHERDISHSSVERIILPDATTLAHYLTRQLCYIVENLAVYPERMRMNLEMTRGLVFSGQLLLDLIDKGLERDLAYDWVQRASMRVWNEGIELKQAALEDKDIARQLSSEEIDRAFDLKRQLRNVDKIFARVFGQ